MLQGYSKEDKSCGRLEGVTRRWEVRKGCRKEEKIAKKEEEGVKDAVRLIAKKIELCLLEDLVMRRRRRFEGDQVKRMRMQEEGVCGGGVAGKRI